MAQYVCQMTNGVMGNYEGSCLAASAQNSWHQERYRVECEDGAVSVGADQVVRVVRHLGGGRVRTEEIEQVRPTYDGHLHIIHDALAWFQGGPAPETQLSDNIKSTAMLFAAIEASERQATVNVREKLRESGIGA
jgi:predicted dehydrogenase